MALPGDRIAAEIAASGLSIYDDLVQRPKLFYDLPTLEARLHNALYGLRLDYPLRTRAKVAKAAVAKALGYAAPKSFRKTQPRFPGQDLDVFVQKSDNLQIWNEEVSPRRRYALMRVDKDDTVSAVRVLTGESIALLDHTGTLTTKFQAKRRLGRSGTSLVTPADTEQFRRTLSPKDLTAEAMIGMTTASLPKPGLVLPIAVVHERLVSLVGRGIVDPGLLQDRNRGAALQKLVGEALGIPSYADTGQFPDVRSQALEVKLQLGPTIDLGLVTPGSPEPAQELGSELRHCDVRYVIAYAHRLDDETIRIDAIVTSTGEGFFEEFQRFEGLITNAKRQIPLPRGLFESE